MFVPSRWVVIGGAAATLFAASKMGVVSRLTAGSLTAIIGGVSAVFAGGVGLLIRAARRNPTGPARPPRYHRAYLESKGYHYAPERPAFRNTPPEAVTILRDQARIVAAILERNAQKPRDYDGPWPPPYRKENS